MTTNEEPNDNKGSGDQIDARHSQGFIGHVSGSVFQNFGEQTNINTEGGDVIGGDKVMGDKVIGDKHVHITQPSLAPALHQLRAPVSDFVGRQHEIDQLVQALSKAASSGAAAAISGVRGMGGIGKTELAHVVAHRLKDVYPDAQLLVELRGASSRSLTPELALQLVIRAFERETKLPDDISQLQGIYRSLLSAKRVLVLADDAEGVKQVRPLLPPPGCALLVTSRNRFSLPGMQTIDLEALTSDVAAQLLLNICPRIDQHSGELAKLCGYLPLALRMSAGLLKENDSQNVERYIEQLRAERLKYLSDPDNTDDPQASVETSLKLSYQALEPNSRRMLCQLSVFPTSFDLSAVVAIVWVSLFRRLTSWLRRQNTERFLEELLDDLRRHSLLEWDAKLQRYRLHDLVRAFGSARLENAETFRLRHARYYAQVARHATELYQQGGEALLAGLALFDRERTHVDVGWEWARERAREQEADRLVLDYADATAYIGDVRYNKRRERIPQLEAAVAAAQRLKNRGGEASALGNLGLAHTDIGEAHKAIVFHEQALAIVREIGDRRGEGAVLGNLGNAYADIGNAHDAITFFEQDLAVAREIGDRRGESAALDNLGLAHTDIGEAHKAIGFIEQALAIVREIGDRRGESAALDNLGLAHTDIGEAHKAIAFHEQALAIAREISDQRAQGAALGNLGLAYDNLSELDRAVGYYDQAVTIAREIGDRAGAARHCWKLGLAFEKQGDLARAAELMQILVDYYREIEHPDVEKCVKEVDNLRQRLAASQNPASAESAGDQQ